MTAPTRRRCKGCGNTASFFQTYQVWLKDHVMFEPDGSFVVIEPMLPHYMANLDCSELWACPFCEGIVVEVEDDDAV